jgi:hypothetical protein
MKILGTKELKLVDSRIIFQNILLYAIICVNCTRNKVEKNYLQQ